MHVHVLHVFWSFYKCTLNDVDCVCALLPNIWLGDITFWQWAHFEFMIAAFFSWKLEKFDPTLANDWTEYIEWIGFYSGYFLTNGVTDTSKQRTILLSSISMQAYIILRSLIYPSTPTDKSFKELVEVMTNYFCPQTSEIVQRFKFNTRMTQPGKSVATYVAEL